MTTVAELQAELRQVRQELEGLRDDIEGTARILVKHEADARAREAESKAKSKVYGDYDSQDARYHRAYASAFGLSLDALFQMTDGKYGREFKPGTATS